MGAKKDDRKEGFEYVEEFMDWNEWEDLCNEVEDLIRDSKESYIGRSYNPEKRFLAHELKWNADGIEIVYDKKKKWKIKAVETGLITAMDRFHRLRNKVIDSPGVHPDGRNYIYVAFRSS